MSQVDLDDLVERCRDNSARVYIREAVDCYRVGGFRACIIMTWISVVFDIVAKLRELALAGDKEARSQVTAFDELNRRNDVEAALKFERDVLDLAASSFELFTAMEVVDLSRLQSDRNRCAHPNLLRDEDDFRATPKLARVHLRNAVDLSLSRPPVQGKAALDVLWREIESLYFPSDVDTAVVALQHSELRRARFPLVKELLLGLLTALLREQLTPAQRQQRLAAFEAVQRLHPQASVDVLSDAADRIFGRVSDDQIARAVSVLHSVPTIMGWLCEATVLKLNNYVLNMPDADCAAALPFALGIETFVQAASARLTTMSRSTLADVVARMPRPIPQAIRSRSIEYYRKAGSFDMANSVADDLLFPLMPSLTADAMVEILHCGENHEVRFSFRYASVVLTIRERGVLAPDRLVEALREAGTFEAMKDYLA